MADTTASKNIGPFKQAQLPSRRSFLSSTAAVGVAAVTGGIWFPGESKAGPPSIGRAPSTWKLIARRVERTFDDGATVPIFGYHAFPGAPTIGEIPLIVAEENSVINLVITNRLAFDIQPEVLSVGTGPIIKPNTQQHMLITMPPAGTYLLTEALLGPAAGPVGFGAMIISRPSSSKDPLPDREYVLLYQDIDDRWNFDLDEGLKLDTSTYEPNYHMVNGLTFPDLASDPDSLIVCKVGENIALKLGNLGHIRHAIHFHGYHAQVMTVNNVPNTMLPMKDTFELPGYGTTDILLPINQPGVFPVHPHSLTTVTANGLYPFGQIILIDAI